MSAIFGGEEYNPFYNSLNFSGGTKDSGNTKKTGGIPPVDRDADDFVGLKRGKEYAIKSDDKTKAKHMQITGLYSGPCSELSSGHNDADDLCTMGEVKETLIKYDASVSQTKTPSRTLENAKKHTHCDDEHCVLINNDFKNFAVINNVNPADIKFQSKIMFKHPGPRNDLSLISNFDIDDTLLAWSRAHINFYPCGYAMMDFAKTKSSLSTIHMPSLLSGETHFDVGVPTIPAKRKFNTMGCVVNTDISSGEGKHWVAVFVSCRENEDNWTIEFFNSSGNKPARELVRWFNQTQNALQDHCSQNGLDKKVQVVIATTQQHQMLNTECGLYSMYYIRSRLINVPHSYFEDNIISDDVMTEFRKYLFRK